MAGDNAVQSIMPSDGRWRLLNTGFLNGPMNMAIDEAIMFSVAEGEAPPTIRLYGWDPFCVSIGYAQRMRKEVDVEACRAKGIDYVRRPTGGRAILHGDELTYSLIVPEADPCVSGGIVESYRRFSMGLLEGLRELGVAAVEADVLRGRLQEKSAACFDAPSHYEVTVGGRKLIGSAQMRRRGIVLQHGTLPLQGDVTRIMDYLRFDSEAQRAALRAELKKKATSLEEALGKVIPFEEVAAALAKGFARSLGIVLQPAELTVHEHQRAEQLYNEKYGTDDWNFMR